MREIGESTYKLNSVIALPSYKNSNGILYRYLHQYRSLILLMDRSMQDHQAVTSLLFYDLEKAELAWMQDWTEYEKQFRIFDIYPVGSCIFSLGISDGKCFLTCMDMKDHLWKSGCIPVDWSCNDISDPRIQIRCDGTTVYVGIQNRKTEFWQFFEVIQTQAELHLKPISFLKGNVTEFQPIASSQRECVFQVSGYDLEIQNGSSKLFQKLNAYKAIIRYSSTGFDRIASGLSESDLDYAARMDTCIYYETIENEKRMLVKYDLVRGTHTVVTIGEKKWSVPSETDLYLYSSTGVRRMSDGKAVTIDAIMHAFQGLNLPAFSEIEPFPSIFFFHDHWLEAELDDFCFFVLHLDTMQAFYFDRIIDIEGDCIYFYT